MLGCRFAYNRVITEKSWYSTRVPTINRDNTVPDGPCARHARDGPGEADEAEPPQVQGTEPNWAAVVSPALPNRTEAIPTPTLAKATQLAAALPSRGYEQR